MPVFLKWIAQFLLLPLLQKGIEWLINKGKSWFEDKRLKEENGKKGDAYENAGNVIDARDTFNKLP
jgi:hypothetical protein